MVLSYYVLKIPYTLVWHFKRLTGTTPSVVFYCGTLLDLTILEPVQKYLQPLPIVAKNRALQKQLQDRGITASVLPSFPRGVIMARHAAYRFPVAGIKKICLSHGAYNFKRFASAKSHNMLDVYFFTSQADVENARRAGIKTGVAVGYPKLDKAFDGSIDKTLLDELAGRIGLDLNKKTVLFTATWDKSGISAIDRWYKELAAFTADYNVLVTVHPWTSKERLETIRNTVGVIFIEGYDVLPYIMLADVCVGDTSSIIGDCCALDKPIVTFRVDDNERSVADVSALIRSISWQVDTLDELLDTLPVALANPQQHAVERARANKVMFDELDGQAGRRAAEVIIGYFPELAPDATEAAGSVSRRKSRE
ncbi:MAG: CDP-glycerol glycerophosphotransferase family protein [Gammaproteobacteria bacterium]|nr:CDP-glycerol glycerophosphotransferase family protein [Gammaproteobacteria bacterium]